MNSFKDVSVTVLYFVEICVDVTSFVNTLGLTVFVSVTNSVAEVVRVGVCEVDTVEVTGVSGFLGCDVVSATSSHS